MTRHLRAKVNVSQTLDCVSGTEEPVTKSQSKQDEPFARTVEARVKRHKQELQSCASHTNSERERGLLLPPENKCSPSITGLSVGPAIKLTDSLTPQSPPRQRKWQSQSIGLASGKSISNSLTSLAPGSLLTGSHVDHDTESGKMIACLVSWRLRLAANYSL